MSVKGDYDRVTEAIAREFGKDGPWFKSQITKGYIQEVDRCDLRGVDENIKVFLRCDVKLGLSQWGFS